jgi:hypothetical protein
MRRDINGYRSHQFLLSRQDLTLLENTPGQRVGERAFRPTLCHDGRFGDKPVSHFVFASLRAATDRGPTCPSGNSPAYRPDTCPRGVLLYQPGVYPAGSPVPGASVAGTNSRIGSANTHQSLSVDRGGGVCPSGSPPSVVSRVRNPSIYEEMALTGPIWRISLRPTATESKNGSAGCTGRQQ